MQSSWLHIKWRDSAVCPRGIATDRAFPRWLVGAGLASQPAPLGAFLLWGTGLQEGESLYGQQHAKNATCFGNVKHYLFRQGYRNNYRSRKTKPCLAPPIYKVCSVHTNDKLFADCDRSIIYVERKGISSNLGTDAVRARLCIFVIRLTKYQFAHKLVLHNGMYSHSPAGVTLKFIIGNNTKWVSYSHLHSISRLRCCIASIFLVILSCWSKCC